MEQSQPRFAALAVKTVVCHTVTYFLMGILAFNLLHYAEILKDPSAHMRPMTSAWVLFGPALQLFRGVLFASVLYPFREQIFGRKHGWLLIAWILIGVGILGTFAAPPGSLEGFIYTTIPIPFQLRGYLEIVPQALLLSILLHAWVRHSGKRWVNWALAVPYALCAVLPVLGLLAQRH